MAPPVIELTYQVAWPSGESQVVPRSDEVSLGDFDCVFDGTTLTVTPRVAFESAEDAECGLDQYLCGRELELELDRRYGMKFRLRDVALIEEGAPGEPTHHFRRMRATVTAPASVAVSLDVVLARPTGVYRSSPRVQQLVTRLRDLREGREKVTAAAYAVLTDIEHTYGGGKRTKSARALNVSTGLLDRMSRLSSAQHPGEGRKVAKAGRLMPADLDWLRRAVPVLVRWVAAVESGATELPLLTLADA